MGNLVRLGALVVYLVGSSILAAEPEQILVQPSANRHEFVLRSARGQAHIEEPTGRTTRLPLHPDELLTALAETRGGWTVAGTRETDRGRQMVLLRGDSTGVQRLRAPLPQRHSLRLRPILMVQQEHFEGIAWLEGIDPTSLSVRSAARSGEEWEEISIVAPPARGSQTGLAGAVLEDNTWLLVWSAFDGRDDEIVWSRGSGTVWARVQRLSSNAVPDITPAVLTVEGGALLAWSRVVDGDYRLMISRFNGTDWTQPQIFGPAGSLEPGFVTRDGALLLIYHHAWPRGWAVADLYSNGRVKRWTSLAEPSADRPVVRGLSDGSLELLWPDEEVRTARWEPAP